MTSNRSDFVNTEVFFDIVNMSRYQYCVLLFYYETINMADVFFITHLLRFVDIVFLNIMVKIQIKNSNVTVVGVIFSLCL